MRKTWPNLSMEEHVYQLKAPIAGTGVAMPDDAFEIVSPTIQKIGDDILVEGEVKMCSRE